MRSKCKKRANHTNEVTAYTKFDNKFSVKLYIMTLESATSKAYSNDSFSSYWRLKSQKRGGFCSDYNNAQTNADLYIFIITTVLTFLNFAIGSIEYTKKINCRLVI